MTTPQVCHATPPPPPPPPEDQLPETLFGFVVWVDQDPLATTEIATTVLMSQYGAPNVYHGFTAGKTKYLECHLDYSIGTKECRITLKLYESAVLVETFAFDPFIVTSTSPFDTGLAHWELVPHPGHIDVREARFSS